MKRHCVNVVTRFSMFNMTEPVSALTIIVTVVIIVGLSLAAVYAVKKAKKDNV